MDAIWVMSGIVPNDRGRNENAEGAETQRFAEKPIAGLSLFTEKGENACRGRAFRGRGFQPLLKCDHAQRLEAPATLGATRRRALKLCAPLRLCVLCVYSRP